MKELAVTCCDFGPAISIENVSEQYNGNDVLVILNPFTFVMLGAISEGISIKSFLLQRFHRQQTHSFTGRQHIVRYEYFVADMQEVGIVATTEFMPTEVRLCASGRALVRRAYRQDFELGDYE